MENKEIVFSVIVPIYNVEAYLEDCINSLLNQSFKMFELILVDDGSTDNSSVICDMYQLKDNRVQVIHKKNGGLVSARKEGVSIAKGDYAVCVDGDDWVDREYLQEIKQIIDSHSPDIICFNHYEVNGKTVRLRNIPFRKGLFTKKDMEKEIYPQLIRNERGAAFPPTIWAKIYKMGIYKDEQSRVDDRIKIGEDAACTIPCMLRAESVYILDKALYYYRRNNISMTKVRKPISWDGPELIEVHLRERIKENGWDVQNQISRRTVQALFNVVKTQFYGKCRYIQTKKNIKENLHRGVYYDAIRKSRFKLLSTTGLFHFFLKHGIVFPFYVLSIVK